MKYLILSGLESAWSAPALRDASVVVVLRHLIAFEATYGNKKKETINVCEKQSNFQIAFIQVKMLLGQPASVDVRTRSRLASLCRKDKRIIISFFLGRQIKEYEK